MSETFRLEMSAGFSGGDATGVFEAFVNAEDSDSIRTGFLLDGAFDQTLSQLSGFLGVGETDRKGFHLDLGGGHHAVGLQAEVTSGPTSAPGGDILQWGSSPDPTVFDETTATGESALRKTQVFQHYLRVSGSDSLSPATLHWGEYSTGGVLSPLNVVFEEPSFERAGPDKYRFNAIFIETASLSDAYDGLLQTPW